MITILISDYWLRQNEYMHKKRPAFGSHGARWGAVVFKMIKATEKYMAKKARVLDYGCGKGGLQKTLRNNNVVIDAYDPAIAEHKDELLLTKHYNLLVCTDVLEHVEPAYVSNVANLLVSNLLAKNGILFAVVSLVPSKKIMPGGCNAHITIRDSAYWISIFKNVGGEIVASNKNKKGVFIFALKNTQDEISSKIIAAYETIINSIAVG